MSSPTPAPAVFIDRDGTLMEEVHYCSDPEKVRVFAGAGDALRALKTAGFRTVLVTNQSGIARGLITLEQYEAVHARLLEQLGSGALDAAFMCADGPETPSLRRKPEPGMLLEAAEKLNLDLKRSWIIGDKRVDVECGARAGVPGILVRTGYGHSVGECGAVHTAEDVVQAAAWILKATCAG